MLRFVASLQASFELIGPVLRKKPEGDLVFPPLPCLSYARVPGQQALRETSSVFQLLHLQAW